MAGTRLQIAAVRRAEGLVRDLAEDFRRLREDAGVTQRALARAAGVDQAVISRLESGQGRPSIETYARLSAALGSDLSVRVFPNTGPAIRDRHQARISEALIRAIDRRWTAVPEVGVRQPVRGWIDLALVDRSNALVVAVEVQSALHRLEQLVRWAGAKAEALPSAQGWPFGLQSGSATTVTKLLVVRSTASTRAIVTTFESTLSAAYPGDRIQALAALEGHATWPGSSFIWAVDRKDGGVELRAGVRAAARQAHSRRPEHMVGHLKGRRHVLGQRQ